MDPSALGFSEGSVTHGSRRSPWGSLGFAALWLGLIGYACLGAPPDAPDTVDLILRLSTGQWTGINPWIVVLFNLMGIWPMAYGAVLASDGVGQRLPMGQPLSAAPFAIAAFGVGAFGILPYLALRQPNTSLSRPLGWWGRLSEGRWLGWAIALGSLALLSLGLGSYGLSPAPNLGEGGAVADFIQQWRTSRFIHVMGLDFVLLTLLFPVLALADRDRRRDQRRWPWLALVFPLVGAGVYLACRKPLGSQIE